MNTAVLRSSDPSSTANAVPQKPLPHATTWRVVYGIVIVLTTVLAIAWQMPVPVLFTDLAHYAPVHTIFEVFAVTVSVLVFGVGWNSYSRERNGNVSVLAAVFISVAILDVMHLLSYAGMPAFITPSSPEKAIDFWLAARLAAVFALFIVATRSWKKSVSTKTALIWIASSLGYAAAVTWLVLFENEWLPRTFMAESGLTTFKIGFEWFLVSICAVSALSIWGQRKHPFPRYDIASLFAAVTITLLSELCFTLYTNVADTFNLMGHLYKVIAYIFIYRAVFVLSVRAPYVQLKESETRYQKILESAPDAIIGVDDAQRIVNFNASAEDLFGYKANELLGESFDILVPPQRGINPNEYMQSFFHESVKHKRTGVDRTVIGLKKDGTEIIAEVSLAQLEMDGSLFVIAMVRDVTQQRRAEEEIKALNAELEHRVQIRTAQLEASNKELESFSYSVSHDLRAPLRTINGFAQILQQDYGPKLDDEARSHLARICAATQHMGTLIDDLLNLARLARCDMNPEKLNLSDLVARIVQDLKEDQPDRVVDVSISPDIMATGDRRLLQIALTNLVGNAWKFTSKSDSARIEFGVKQEADKTIYFIRDNGAGFDMRFANKLFAIFQRLHDTKEFPGTGIGLATVSRIIHRHGGDIWGEGVPGKGACFYFTLGSTPANPLN